MRGKSLHLSKTPFPIAKGHNDHTSGTELRAACERLSPVQAHGQPPTALRGHRPVLNSASLLNTMCPQNKVSFLFPAFHYC